MNEALGLIHPRAELLSISECVERESKGLAHKIRWLGRHKAAVQAFPFEQGQTEGEKRESLVPGNFTIQLGKLHELSRPGNNPLWIKTLLSGPAALAWWSFFLFLDG